MNVDIFNTENKYDMVYSDPPWEQKKGNLRKCRPKQGKELDYCTMKIEDIEKLHKEFLQHNVADAHNVYMWTIDKFLPKTEEFMQKLGYTLHARMIWDKENGVAPAFTVRFSHEYLLWFYKKGQMLKPTKETRGKYTTVLREKATVHSKKPICAYQMLEDMFPNARKIELFARTQRAGWDCWGNETDKFTWGVTDNADT